MPYTEKIKEHYEIKAAKQTNNIHESTYTAAKVLIQAAKDIDQNLKKNEITNLIDNLDLLLGKLAYVLAGIHMVATSKKISQAQQYLVIESKQIITK